MSVGFSVMGNLYPLFWKIFKWLKYFINPFWHGMRKKKYSACFVCWNIQQSYFHLLNMNEALMMFKRLVHMERFMAHNIIYYISLLQCWFYGLKDAAWIITEIQFWKEIFHFQTLIRNKWFHLLSTVRAREG